MAEENNTNLEPRKAPQVPPRGEKNKAENEVVEAENPTPNQSSPDSTSSQQASSDAIPVAEQVATGQAGQVSEANPVPANPDEPTEQTPNQTETSAPVEVPPVNPEAPPSPESAIPVNNDISALPSQNAPAGQENELFSVKSAEADHRANKTNQSLPSPSLEAPDTAKAMPDESADQREAPTVTVEKHGRDVIPNQSSQSSDATGQAITEVMQPIRQAQDKPKTPVYTEAELEKQRRENLIKANLTRQNKKRKKIDKILTLFAEKQNGSTSPPQVTNDEVEKLLHVSDATATRYLDTLEKEGKIRQVGKTGKYTHYEKI